MKREFLKNLGLTDEVIDSIMAENGKDIEAEKKKTTSIQNKLDTVNTELTIVKEQLTNANTTIQSYKDMDIEGIKQSAEEWKTKYEEDTKKLQDDLKAKDYDYAVKEYMNSFKFIDDEVKELVINKFKEKSFKHEEGKFLGADEFMKEYKEAHKGLFVPDEPQDPVPTIVKPTNGDPTQKGPKLTLTQMMVAANKNN